MFWPGNTRRASSGRGVYVHDGDFLTLANSRIFMIVAEQG
jgi:hypothetical protein